MSKNSKFITHSPLVQREDFSKYSYPFDELNLLEIQKNSFSEKNLKVQLKDLFEVYFPIMHDKNKKYRVVFRDLSFEKPDNFFSPDEALEKGRSYEKALFVDLGIEDLEMNKCDFIRKDKKNKANGIFFGCIPMITDKGTFIVNGVEKNVLSQIVRSPGLYVLNRSRVKLSSHTNASGDYFCELLANRGSAIHFYVSKAKILKFSIRSAVQFAKSKEYNATLLLKALGLGEDEILEIFNHHPIIVNTLKDDIYQKASLKDDKDFKRHADAKEKNPGSFSLFKTVRELYKKYVEQPSDKILDQLVSEWCAWYFIDTLGISVRVIENEEIETTYQEILSKYLFNPRSYDILGAGRYKLNRKFQISDRLFQRIIVDDLKTKSGKVLLPAKSLILKNEITLIKKAFMNGELDLSFSINVNNPAVTVGNKDLKKQPTGLEKILVFENNNNLSPQLVVPIIAPNVPATSTSLLLTDLISIASYTIGLQYNIGEIDIIEHIGNKRLRLIHEQLKAKLNIGLMKVEKHIKEKLSQIYSKTATGEQKEKNERKATVKNIVNTKEFQKAIHAFFNTYSLTQFVDQQNPLSELSAKRKISAMGDGGISRDDPNLEVRDIHYSQFGRICPIESPEGMSIGLIMSLAGYTKIDDNGFLLSPYFKVNNGVITKDVEWLNALKEDEHSISEFCIPHDDNGKITVNEWQARYHGVEDITPVAEIEYVSISPKQFFSISTGLIPFVENDEGHRAEMAANMQRQALPLLRPHAPTVGTGGEYRVAHDSQMGVISEVDGTVTFVDGKKITVDSTTYRLNKYLRSNQDTCINHTPIVNVGQKVKSGEIIADCSGMNNGELSLGQNMLIAFVSWSGYNFEDAIVISERVYHEDLYSSITIEEYEVHCQRTKNGDEEITRDIPNTSDESKRYLDEDGIILVGAEVKEGDILVGKITPRGQVEVSGEEKLLQALFGPKTGNYKDSSLRLPYGVDGVVCRIQKFDARDKDILQDDDLQVIKVFIAQKRKIQVGDKLAGRHGNKGVVSIVVPVEDMPHLEDGTIVDVCLNPHGIPSRMNIGQLLETHLGYAERLKTVDRLINLVEKGDAATVALQFGIDEQRAKLLLKVCDKYFKDNGWDSAAKARNEFKVIDLSIVLNQVGLLIEDLNYKVQSPIFNGITANEITTLLDESGVDVDKTHAKVKLIDGRTGECLDHPVTVGVMYVMKLDHMADDKIHARSIGPYSRVTQQPLGGKSQNGGQRCGEMEVWALEGYGAAYNIQELMTIKSDDMESRKKAYSAIIRHGEIPQPSIPDAFKLLTKQLQGLCLKIDVITDSRIIDMDDFVATKLDFTIADPNAGAKKIGESESSSFGESEID